MLRDGQTRGDWSVFLTQKTVPLPRQTLEGSDCTTEPPRGMGQPAAPDSSEVIPIISRLTRRSRFVFRMAAFVGPGHAIAAGAAA